MNSIIFYIIGPRSAWDTVEVGPFSTQETAGSFCDRHNISRSLVQARSATGLEALKVMELLEKEAVVA